MSKYGDKVTGSLGADIIYANSGDDHIYGSQFINPKTDNRTQEEKDADSDYIVGGDGVDTIWGVAGNDILYAGEVDEHLIKGNDYHLDNNQINDNARGDWVICGDGSLYGKNDFDFFQLNNR